MNEILKQWADDRGYRVAWGPATVVRQARAEIRARRDSGELDADFCNEQLEFLLGGGENEVGKTVVVVAVPRPAHRVDFELDERRLEALLPPTYMRYRATFEEVRQDLAENGLPEAQVEHLTAPLKTVASMLGLVRYGRNNLAYAEDVGSYLQLCGFLTDAAILMPEDMAFSRPELLPECDDCTRCLSACPTNAIHDDRVLLSARHCITLANENPGSLPDSIPRRAHHCLVGCLRCQRACPVNPKLPIEASGVCFSAAETQDLLDGDIPVGEKAESGIRAKLAALGQPGLEPVLGRNLRAVRDGRGGGPESQLSEAGAPGIAS